MPPPRVDRARLVLRHQHVAGLESGLPFGPPYDQHPYSLLTNWVSDFAAVSPWVKGAIVAFSLAPVDFFTFVARRVSGRGHANAMKLWWMAVATLMVGGLLMVILFDQSPTRFRYVKPSVWQWLSNENGTWVEVERSGPEMAGLVRHRFGFSTFVIGFFLGAVSLLAAGSRAGRSDSSAWSWYILLLSTATAVWLFALETHFPGVPQRVFLLLIPVWMVRHLLMTRGDGAASPHHA